MSSSFTLNEGTFTAVDYTVFGILCVFSCIGGIWYGAVGSKVKAVMDLKDYLLGGKAMSTFPVALSLIASYVSGVTILGTPAEIYNYGSQYWLIVVGVCLSCAVVAVVYLPVFFALKVSSSYEYLELRFNRHVRAIASVLFLMDEILFLPMVVYVPALAFNQLTGFSVYAVGGVMVLITGMYTVLGGLKAVVWTDSVQTVIMYVGVLFVAVAGTVAAGSIKNVIHVAQESNRLDVSNWDFSPYARQTGWGAVVGGFLYWTCFNSVNQTMVQRYIALATKRKAIGALAIFCVGAILAISLCVWCGLAAFAVWVQTGCSPSGAPLVTDRLLPAFVTYVSRVRHLPGLSGVFLAGVFGAGLSSLSAVLNACALVAVEDIMHSWLRLELTRLYTGVVARVVTAVLAVVSLLMLIVVAQLGGVLGVATALSAIAASATCGIFTLGMCCWWVGPRGALVGGAAGALVAGAVSVGSQAAAAAGLRAPPLPVAAACAANATLATTTINPLEEFDPSTIFPLFRVSYHWIAPMGLFTTLLVGALVGWLWDARPDLKMDAELYSPVVWRWLPAAAHERAGVTRLAAAAKRADAPQPSSPLILSAVNGVNKIEMTEKEKTTR